MRFFSICIGSVSYFEDFLDLHCVTGDEMNQKVLEHDQAKSYDGFYSESDCLIVRNNHYLTIVESAHARLGPLLEDLTSESAQLFIHNPPLNLLEYLRTEYERGNCQLREFKQERQSITEIDNVRNSIDSIKCRVIGQDCALDEIGKSLLYLTVTKQRKPFVLMLYGKSSLGKTETAKAIANEFYGGKMIEKHMSMFATGGYASYLFGDKPTTSSLGYDLNQRESNFIFLDEIDKCPDVFHSAFYTLFDSPVYLDATYEVDIANLVIMLTCNYLSEDEICKNLGEPIYYRIDKCIKYEDLSPESALAILRLEANRQLLKITEDNLNEDAVISEASKLIPADSSNGRLIQKAVRKTIEDMIWRTQNRSDCATANNGLHNIESKSL